MKKSYLIGKLMGVILGMLTPELLKSFADMFLDWVENFVLGTKSKVDDFIVLPLCAMIRNTFDIPDGDTAIEDVAPNKDPDTEGDSFTP